MIRRISVVKAGVTRSSASTERTQSPDASESAKFRWLAKSSNARTATTSACCWAISRVASRLTGSTTMMRSNAQLAAAEARAGAAGQHDRLQCVHPHAPYRHAPCRQATILSMLAPS